MVDVKVGFGKGGHGTRLAGSGKARYCIGTPVPYGQVRIGWCHSTLASGWRFPGAHQVEIATQSAMEQPNKDNRKTGGRMNQFSLTSFQNS